MRFLRLFFLSFIVPLVAFAQTPAPTKSFTRTLYLVRHGHYDSDPKAGVDGPGLSPLGIAQAKLIAARLRGMPVAFSSLTSSTMTRAHETALEASRLLPEMKLQATPLLRECTPRALAVKGVPVEDTTAAEKQLDAAYAKFFVPAAERDEHDILVCHGNVIRYLTTKALGVDTQAWAGFSIAHCSLTVIQIRADGSCRILAVGDIGHIPPNLQSGATAAAVPALVVDRE